MTRTPSTQPPHAHGALSGAELQRRMVFALMRPAMRLCRVFRLPMVTVEELCRMAYFEEIRMRGHHSQAETAELMDRSLRTVGNLERQYRSDFLAPETELTWMRDLEHALSDAPLTRDQLADRLSDVDGTTLDRLLAGLVTMQRLTAHDDGRYALNRDFVSLVRDDLDAQLDGLRHQLDVIVQTVLQRFVGDRTSALARTLSFVALPGDMATLSDDLIRELRSRCIDAEERALKSNDSDRYAVTLAITPTDREPHI